MQPKCTVITKSGAVLYILLNNTTPSGRTSSWWRLATRTPWCLLLSEWILCETSPMWDCPNDTEYYPTMQTCP